MAIQLTPNKVKSSLYLLIPSDIANLLEIQDSSILKLTVEHIEARQRLVYLIQSQEEVESRRTSLPKMPP